MDGEKIAWGTFEEESTMTDIVQDKKSKLPYHESNIIAVNRSHRIVSKQKHHVSTTDHSDFESCNNK